MPPRRELGPLAAEEIGQPAGKERANDGAEQQRADHPRLAERANAE